MSNQPFPLLGISSLLTHDVYCDGGLITPNPSKTGGTFAFVYVQNDQELILVSGTVRPEEAGLDVITNNYTELLAAVSALEPLSVDWRGELYTDSYVTQCRLINAKPKFAGIPSALIMRVEAVRSKFVKPLRVNLLDGHPNAAQLREGFGKRGNPVSKWNVRCDKECGRLAEVFKGFKGGQLSGIRSKTLAEEVYDEFDFKPLREWDGAEALKSLALDGLMEDVSKVATTPKEMDFLATP